MKAAVFCLLQLLAALAFADIRVYDDAGNLVVLPAPATRVVSLAPHVTELLFAAGAGERIVGTVSHSDFPPAARDIARVGGARQIDIERLLALRPDLLIVWLHDASMQQLEQLRRLKLPLFYSKPQTLEDVPEAILRMGRLSGTEQQARLSAEALRARIDRLRAQYSARPPVRVFYQIWDDPLYTLNGAHILSHVIQTCGGENIFAGLSAPAPAITPEAVLQENPEVILAGDRRDRRDQAGDRLEIWRRYGRLHAVQAGNLIALDADLLHRPGPRIVDGAEAVCARLEEARTRRGGQ